MYTVSNTRCQIFIVISTVLYTYPIVICDINISFFVNKELHYLIVAFSSCHVQRSPLIKKKAIVHDLEINCVLSDPYLLLAIPKVSEFEDKKENLIFYWSTINSRSIHLIVILTLLPSLTLISAPCSTRYLTVSIWFLSTAKCRGVLWRKAKKSCQLGIEFNVDIKIAPLEMRIT